MGRRRRGRQRMRWLDGIIDSVEMSLRNLHEIVKDSDAGKVEGGRRRGRQRMRWLDGIIDSMDMSLSVLRELVMDTGRPGVLRFMGSQRVGHD